MPASSTTSNHQPTVIITETLSDGPADWLAERANVVWCPHTEKERLAKLLPQADGLVVRTYTQVNQELLDQAPNLKVVGRAGVGLDNFDLPACEKANVKVVYTPDANSQAVVEYVIALILDTLRPRTDLPPACSEAIFHQLRKTEIGKQLDQLTLGIVGLGRVGKRLANVAHAIGMKILVSEIIPETDLRRACDLPFNYVPHDTLYAEADIVSIHVDGRPENKHMLSTHALSQLKPNTLLINAARGFLHKNETLLTFAQNNPEAHIILDVHDPEPPSLDYILANQPNIRLLPHIASRTDQALENMSWVVRDILAVLENKSPNFPAF
ncbi:NAD(P)-dependent oxidoreductase [Poriferisphaera sp. WC338]|uniref:NAD(P)-dependent oxidoreductase n=1 Tax=Poriferisphaera sp. WC338 TaxID=3425129 RepID=UPI003D814341